MTDTHIKIKPAKPRVQYTGNGVTTTFPYEFAIFDETDMVVYVDDDIIESGYTVTGAGETDGGTVVFDTAPDDGIKITLLRNVPIERVTDFQEGGTFRPKNLNDEFDRQTAFVQQVQEILDRSVKVGPTSDVEPEEVLSQVERIYGSIDNVDAVADNLTSVYAVASDLTNIDAVASNQTNIDTVANNANNINSVAGNATNINAVAGNSTNINAVAGNESDINTVAGISSDVSTVASNTSNVSNVATNISAINNCATNMAAIQDAPNQAQAAADSAVLSAQYANDKINQTHISNCITHIPQDIKLELNNGTLTLKAGSKVYSSSGVWKVMSYDSSVSWGYSGSGFVFVKSNGGLGVTDSGSESVSTLPTPATTYKIFYNTTDGKCYFDSNNSQMEEISFPIATFTADNGIKSIDQVFNGFGYIGSTVFALPGVEGLIPNGRNADGSLKNTEFTVNSVLSRTTTDSGYSNGIVLGFSPLEKNVFGFSTNAYYDEKQNYSIVDNSNWRRVLLGVIDKSSGKYTNLVCRGVFHALDYNDKETIVGWGMPDYSNPTATGVSLSNGDNTVTLTQPSYIIARTSDTTNDGYILIKTTGGNIISQQYVAGSTHKRLTATAFLDKGSYSINVTGSGDYSVYPLKGVV